MAAAAPVRPLDVNNHDRPGNRCPICQEWQTPDWRDIKSQRRPCCGVLICNPCWKDWDKERSHVSDQFFEAFGRRGFQKYRHRHDKRLEAWVRGETENKDEAQSKKKKDAAGKKEEQKKQKLEKLLDRHFSCPNCRAPIPVNAEDMAAQMRVKAEQGHSWAQCMLGIFYCDGQGVRKDARQAERWFRAAMENMSAVDGGPKAALILGTMHAEGSVMRKNLEEAKKLLTMAHEAGLIHAANSLSELFHGHYGPAAGVPDLKKAAAVLRVAAEAGDNMGQHNLGVCYVNGEGVEQDKAKAKAWYAKAAKQGYTDAMYSLAKLLHETEDDAVMPEMMALLRAAAEKGGAEAQAVLPMMEKKILSRCWSCGKPRADMAEDPKRCNRCFAVAYCSPACQKQHWKRGGHKVACNEREKYLPEKDEDEE